MKNTKMITNRPKQKLINRANEIVYKSIVNVMISSLINPSI